MPFMALKHLQQNLSLDMRETMRQTFVWMYVCLYTHTHARAWTNINIHACMCVSVWSVSVYVFMYTLRILFQSLVTLGDGGGSEPSPPPSGDRVGGCPAGGIFSLYF